MEGQYDVDDNYDVITLMLGSDMSTVLQYYYNCEGDELTMQNFTNTSLIDNYVKVTE